MKHSERKTGGARAEKKNRTPSQRWEQSREWLRVNLRRWVCEFHDAATDRRAMHPLSFLGISAVLGAALTVGVLYSSSYAVTVDGQDVGVVADQSVVDTAMENVEKQGRAILGSDYQVAGEVDYSFKLSLKTDLSGEDEIEDYFYGQLSELSDELRKYEVVISGRPMGVVEDEAAFRTMLADLKLKYNNEHTVSAEFLDTIDVQYVYDAEEVLSIDQMRAVLEANTTGDTTYTVAQGDTFNGIAYANDMSVSDLKALNPKVQIDRLMIGDVLNVKEQIPALSIQTVDHVEYTEPIPCPEEVREDASMFKGESKIQSEGVPGESLVTADVTYVNGVEESRNIVSTVTQKEPTPTVKIVGTKEKPKTASTGQLGWPVRGRITSYFGRRHIFGKTSFHSGLDIAAPMGTPIHAADGGKVTFAGKKGSYGNLVIITHDNGMQTYYGHNSSLLVSAGQRVHKGQVIAKCGSTGRSTGPHCHFEVRLHGKAVNPLNYLP